MTAIEGYVDRIDENGVIHGWARNRTSAQACIVEIRDGDQIIAQAVADDFRGDLFRDGVGHGHYGYCARILHDQPVEAALALFDAATGTRLNPEDFTVHHAAARTPPKLTVEDLYQPRPGWQEGDLFESVGSLQLEAALRSMHTLRFLDVILRFLLNRWSTEAERAQYLAGLKDGSLHPNELFRAVLTSTERRTNGLPLVGPYHYRFPFDPALFLAPE